MKKNFLIVLLIYIFTFGCENSKLNHLSIDEIKEICIKKKQMAISPQSKVNISKKSHKPLNIGFSIKLSSDFLTKKDPKDVYEKCINNLSK